MTRKVKSDAGLLKMLPAKKGFEVVVPGGGDVPGNSNTQLGAYLETRLVDPLLGATVPVKVTGAALDLITEAERALAEFLEVDLAASTEVLLWRVRENSRVLLAEEIRMGLRLMALKGRLGHGDFLPAIADIGIPDRAAQRAMQTARAFASEGDARRRQQLLDMGKSKGTALLLAKPEVREQILNDPELSQEAMEASKLELQRLLKDKEAQIDRHQQAYADLETKLETKELELRKLSRVDPAALLTRSMRAEAVAEAAAIQECCDNLARLWEAAIKNDAERDVRQRAVALAVGAGMAHLDSIYRLLKDDLGGALPLTPGVMDDLTQEERLRAAECAERVRVQFLVRREHRRDEAYAEHLADGGQKKRGRPAKKQGAQ